ncbi:uncharacterized protein RAG0_09617 [Rhynchosporium agropyri]|uniref:Uncharacterized protein n=1 Tax=Rhynchosporium agropyri TaxID=914238 RepID=A0A1E1KWA4_9HELO|nr:uncharacterized protein RAG0_09617 [Rhynchosporium agropyri]
MFRGHFNPTQPYLPKGAFNNLVWSGLVWSGLVLVFMYTPSRPLLPGLLAPCNATSPAVKRAEGTRSEKTKTQQEKPSPNPIPIHKAPRIPIPLLDYPPSVCLAPHPSLPVPKSHEVDVSTRHAGAMIPSPMTVKIVSAVLSEVGSNTVLGTQSPTVRAMVKRCFTSPSVRPSIPGPTSDNRQAGSFSVCVRTSVKSQSNFGETPIFWRRMPIKLSDVYLSACTAPPEVCA